MAQAGLELKELLIRMASIERQNRRLRLTILSLGLCGLAVLLVGQTRPAETTPDRVLRARQFLAVDEAGVVRGEFGVHDGASLLVLNDAKGKQRASLVVPPDGKPSFRLLGNDDIPRLVLKISEGERGESLAALQLVDSIGLARAVLSLARDGWPNLQLRGEHNKAHGSMSLGVGSDGSPRVQLFGRDQRNHCMLGLESDDSAYLVLCDPTGRAVWSAPQMPACKQPELLSIGSIAPAWELKDSKGNLISLKSLKGRVVVIDFWATWCGPCKAAMPMMQALHEQFRDKPVTVIGVSAWEKGDAASFMKEKGYTYGLLLNGDAMAEQYHVSGIPTLYIIGTDGKIFHATKGVDPAHKEKLAKLIDAAVAQSVIGQHP